MLVVLQFPIADGRRFSPEDEGLASRPNWLSPRLAPGGDFVRGFGPMIQRSRPADPAWTDDDSFVMARRGVRFPALIERRLSSGDFSASWRCDCAFRRLFHDGFSTARIELGFAVRPALKRSPTIDAQAVVQLLLAMPATVGSSNVDTSVTKALLLQGSHLAVQFTRASTVSGAHAAASLVANGSPLVVVDAVDEASVQIPESAVDASAATSQRVAVKFALTATPYGKVATWYLGPSEAADPQCLRNLRLCLLHLHAQEETLDQILSWAEEGTLSFVPETDAGDRLENYINRATRFINRDDAFGLQTVSLRDAVDVSTAVQRASVPISRRQRLDGMREQIRKKAERFMAQREALRPVIGGIHVGDTVTISGGSFYGPVAGTVHAQTMQDSFNAFAATQPSGELREQIETLHKDVAILVGELNKTAPTDAADVTGALANFTAEAAKKEPNGITLRTLGQGLVSAAKGVASVAVPIATAVAGVLKVFGLAVL